MTLQVKTFLGPRAENLFWTKTPLTALFFKSHRFPLLNPAAGLAFFGSDYHTKTHTSRFRLIYRLSAHGKSQQIIGCSPAIYKIFFYVWLKYFE